MHCRPSEVMGIEDVYTAFCFDEAIAYIIQRLKDGEEPVIQQEELVREYSRPSDLYNQFD
nr:MAG TPA: hypothetical protein [Caudoviricetes sp.]